MITKISVTNFFSIKETVSISLLSRSGSELSKNIQHFQKYKVLKSLCIHGYNGSGKSNIIKAISFITQMIIKSANNNEIDGIVGFTPFLLDDTSKHNNSSIELNFLLSGKLYRYLLEFNQKEIVQETLYVKQTQKELLIFHRFQKNIRAYKKERKKLELIKVFTKSNSLFLSICAQFNINFAIEIVSWFNKIDIVQNDRLAYNLKFTKNYFKRRNLQNKIQELIKIADLGFQNIIMESGVVKTIHNINNGNRLTNIKFDLIENESLGAKKFISLLGPIVKALVLGSVVVIDEFDSGIHHELGLRIIEIFNSNNNNPKGAQLIFTTHNTKYLDKSVFRRDQQLNVIKNNDGSTLTRTSRDLGLRKDAKFEKEFLKDNESILKFSADQLDLFSFEEE